MLTGLVTCKAAVNIALGPLFGLTRSESIRTGFLLAQGGEFAFVLLSLAEQLQVLPQELNQLLIVVVVLSMALTPVLAEVGKWIADEWERRWGVGGEGGAAAGATRGGAGAGSGTAGHGGAAQPLVGASV